MERVGGEKKGRGLGAKKFSSHHPSQMYVCSDTQDLQQQMPCRPFGPDFGHRLRECWTAGWLVETRDEKTIFSQWKW